MNPPLHRKSVAGNPPPTVRAPVLDPTCEGKSRMAALLDHRRWRVWPRLIATAAACAEAAASGAAASRSGVLYMATVAGIRSDPAIRNFYRQLRAGVRTPNEH